MPTDYEVMLLNSLSFSWHGAYDLSITDGEVWRAVRIGNPTVVLLADSAEDLARKIRLDWQTDADERIAERLRHAAEPSDRSYGKPAEGGSL